MPIKFYTVLLITLATTFLQAESSVSSSPLCAFNDLLFDTDFDGGRIDHCEQTGTNKFTLGVIPEHKPINKSPWYAFKLLSEKKRNIEVFLHYGHHQHRYAPKISKDGKQWQRLSESKYKIVLAGKAIKMNLKASKEPIYIAAQPIIDNKYYRDWLEGFTSIDNITLSKLGQSIQNRPIYQLTSEGSSNQWVLIVGRQHPSEVTGALGLFAFVDEIMADSELAKQFRERYNLLIIPNLNPDGVANGNWRYNTNNVDLNRDWGVYQQPEISAVEQQLKSLFEDSDQQLVLGFDFHSTRKDVFYTQRDDLNLNMPYFTRDWLAAVQSSMPNFKVLREVTHNPGLATFKTFMSDYYKIPAITFEIGDDTEYETIGEVGKISAQAMMQILINNHESI